MLLKTILRLLLLNLAIKATAANNGINDCIMELMDYLALVVRSNIGQETFFRESLIRPFHINVIGQKM